MYYLAFDVSKAKVDGILTNLRTKVKYFQVENNENALSDWIKDNPLPKKVCVGSESTGNYHLALQRFFVNRGYTFKLLNPIVTNQFIKTTIRKKKTDKTDSMIIAKLLSQGEGREIQKEDLDTEKKTAQRIWGKMIEEQSRLKKMRKNLFDHAHCPLASDAIISLETTINEKIKTYEKELETKYGKDETIVLLKSIPGIGFKLAFIIMTEVGRIDRLSNASKLVALAGLDPKVRQSGHCLNSVGRLTKRGSPRLRYALFLGANVARMYDEELKAHYRKKISEGKRHTAATCSVARKLAHRVYAVWSRGVPYEKHSNVID